MGGRLVKEEDYATPATTSTGSKCCILPEKSKFCDLKVIIGIVTLSVISTVISTAALSVVLATLHLRTETLDNAGGRGDVATTEKVPVLAPEPSEASSTFIGCYKDDFDRDMPFFTTFTNNSVKKCAKVCKRKGYTYAGLQFGIECFCGNTFGRHGISNLAECNKPCPGDTAEFCCGYLRNAIYSTGYGGPVTTQTTIETTYLGCFDDDSNRDLPLMLVARDNDVPGCQEKCRNRGYWYAGVQHGRECFCGNHYGIHGKSEESHCNMTCSGNKEQICGGYWQSSIYTSGYTGPACLDGYQLNPFSETCLILVDEEKNWDQAATFCESRGEHLAVFNSADYIMWFKSLRQTEWNSTRTYYIGGRRIGGQWMWRGRINTTIKIADWEQVQPDGSGDCLVVFNFGRAQPSTLFENYKWDDASCDVQQYFVCERGAERQLN